MQDVLPLPGEAEGDAGVHQIQSAITSYRADLARLDEFGENGAGRRARERAEADAVRKLASDLSGPVRLRERLEKNISGQVDHFRSQLRQPAPDIDRELEREWGWSVSGRGSRR